MNAIGLLPLTGVSINHIHRGQRTARMSRSRSAEGDSDRNSKKRGGDLSGGSSDESLNDTVEVENKAQDERATKRQRLRAETSDTSNARSRNAVQSQLQGDPSGGIQQNLIRHFLNHGNHMQTFSAQDFANAELSAQLRTILVHQQIVRNGGYFPPLLRSTANFAQNGTLDTLARLAVLPGVGFGYPGATPLAPLGQMPMPQQYQTLLPDSIGSTLSGNFSQSGVPVFTQQLTGRPSVPLSIEADQRTLSEFQRLVRKHIELFEAIQEDVESNAQGRNRPIVLGQVGIRCCHCAHLPPKLRCRGATYYPTTLQGLYQAAQNMATGHLCKRCPHVPSELREELIRLKECKSSAGGGKTYWGDGVRSLGVIEAPNGLRFLPRS